jgi:shikimate dehydrogenase
MTVPMHPLGATTELVALIGHPVRHSLSPVIANAAFREMGLDWAFVVCDVAPGGGRAAIGAARDLGFRGLSVTMPHKADAAAAVDSCTEAATSLGAVNCVAIADGATFGHNTDGAGFVASLRAEAEIDPIGRTCAVLGAGGAARSIIRALADAGATEVLVLNRTAATAEAAALVAPGVARIATLDEVAESSEVVVNATSVGMDDPGDPTRTGETPIEVGRLRSDAVVADIVYHPLRTALLDAADRRGLRTVGGVGMLVHQAALGVEIWTGQPAPIVAMTLAARGALEG